VILKWDLPAVKRLVITLFKELKQTGQNKLIKKREPHTSIAY
jgi:hypothetical protein